MRHWWQLWHKALREKIKIWSWSQKGFCLRALLSTWSRLILHSKWPLWFWPKPGCPPPKLVFCTVLNFVTSAPSVSVHLHVESKGWQCIFKSLVNIILMQTQFWWYIFESKSFKKVWERSKGGDWHTVYKEICSLDKIGMQQLGQDWHAVWRVWCPRKGRFFSCREKRDGVYYSRLKGHLPWKGQTSDR